MGRMRRSFGVKSCANASKMRLWRRSGKAEEALEDVAAEYAEEMKEKKVRLENEEAEERENT